MDKTTHFFGNSVFGQLISLINTEFILQAAKSTVSLKFYLLFTFFCCHQKKVTKKNHR